MNSDYLNIQPRADEYAEYYGRYIHLVPTGNILEILSAQIKETLAVFSNISEAEALYRPGPEEWSTKEVIGHVIDAERVFSYRALVFARDDKNPIVGFDQDEYVQGAIFDAYPLTDLLEELRLVRQTTLFLLKNLTAEMWQRRGIASENAMSVRAAAYVIAGHERHHLESLRTAYRLG